MDLTRLRREALKSIAFPYHYGQYTNAEQAKSSLAGQAAAELARRGGYEVPEPHVLALMHGQ